MNRPLAHKLGLFAVVGAVSLVAASAWAGTCTGKQNGLWCAGSDLVYCSGGNVSWKVWCDAGCKSMPAGTPDKCNAGFCNGKQPGLWCKGNDLVNCKNGGISSSKKCSNGCQSMPAGTADKCKDGCSGFCCGKQSGLWCDGDNLVNCQGGKASSSKKCANGCQQMPTGTPDKCKSGCSGFCCSKASGYWCDGAKLVLCKSGTVASSKTCSDGCQSMPAGTDDVCKTPTSSGFCSGKANGLWCEGTNLVNCQANKKASSTSCAHGCKSNPPGTPDACKAPPDGGGSGGGGNLKICNPFNPSKNVTCKFGCYSGHLGSDYACANGTPVYAPIAGKVTFVKNSVPGQTCKPDFGNYIKIGQGSYEVFLAHLRKDIKVSVGQEVKAGDHVAYASNSGYTLTLKSGKWVCQQGGGYHLHLEVRKSGKSFDPYKSGDVDWTSCDKAVPDKGGTSTDWCNGKQSGKWCKGEHLVSCQSNATASTTKCDHGCKSNPPGVPDSCKPAPGFCGGKSNGHHCDGQKLILCHEKAQKSETICPFGCVAKPAGTADVCSDPPSWCNNKSDGKHCKSNIAITCKDGKQVADTPCNNGCGELGEGKGAGCLPVVLDAFCGDKSDGDWCGDGGAVVSCIAGKKKGFKTCDHGCDGKGPGGDDACKPPPKPADVCHVKADGSWCIDKALVTCKVGKTVQAQVCADGCDGVPGAAKCKQKIVQPKDFCDGKVSGDHCNGPTLVTCSNGETVGAKLCVKGCLSKGEGVPDTCDEPPVCEAKVQGDYCVGQKLVKCAAGKEIEAKVCVGGCASPSPGEAWCNAVDVGSDAGSSGAGIGDVHGGSDDSDTANGGVVDGSGSQVDGVPGAGPVVGTTSAQSGGGSACQAAAVAPHSRGFRWIFGLSVLLWLAVRRRSATAMVR